MQASQGHGLLRLGPLRGRSLVTRENPRECQYFSRFPAASRKFELRSCSAAPAAAGSPPRAQRGQLVRRPGLLGPHAGPTPRLPDQAARCLPAGAHGNAPPRGPCPTAAPRPGRDSWVPKGLSRQRRAARVPSAQPIRREPAPARTRPPVTCGRVRAPPPPGRSLPGAAPQPAPSARRRALRWLLGHSSGRRGVGAITIY